MNRPIKVEILNAILFALNQKSPFLISAFLNNNYRLDKEESELYQIRLNEDGFISLKLISAGRQMASITSAGKLFLNEGGYKRTANEIAQNIINKQSVQVSNNNNSPISSTNLLLSDKAVIKHILMEILKIQAELEKLEYYDAIKIRSCDASLTTLMKKVFPSTHVFFPKESKGVINKDELIALCGKIKVELEFELLEVQSDLSFLNPKLKKACEPQFLHGHYSDSVFNAFKCIEIEVKEKIRSINSTTEILDRTGIDLMNKAFNETAPLIRFSSHNNEQMAIKFLYAGAMGAIRNPHGHSELMWTKQQALDCLHFANLLLNWLERPETYR